MQYNQKLNDYLIILFVILINFLYQFIHLQIHPFEAILLEIRNKTLALFSHHYFNWKVPKSSSSDTWATKLDDVS